MELRKSLGFVGDLNLLGDEITIEILQQFPVEAGRRLDPHRMPAVAELNVIDPDRELDLRARVAEVSLASAAERKALRVIRAEIAEKHRRIRPGQFELAGGRGIEERRIGDRGL